MRLKRFLKNLVRRGLKICIILFLVYGCTSSTKPTYTIGNIAEAIQNISKNEYQMDVKATLAGSTLWIYLPVEDTIVKSDKPEKYSEKFNIESNQNELQEGFLKLNYIIYPILEKEKIQEYKYNKDVLDKINSVWRVLRRVIFSMERSEACEPKFFCLVVADIKTGYEMQYIFYNLDLKKFSYENISMGEYQHRIIQDTQFSPAIIGDKEGQHINYREIIMDEFITRQIDYRIKLKFQKPEVDKKVDIDKEILKIVANTVKIYDFKDFTAVELNNLFTGKRLILSHVEIWTSPID